ncbi:type IV pilus assembly protein PilN [Formivibrio citricus]|uniref:Type IV pilus assembly protein PilN n=1 Tax=Formivibrio citricus TaxID=83765 RepID=A0A1I4XPF2_9NEIS|nr:PilN domain-containing protein [Formivibrio citricus]SFN27682.1 type IV pilus assembly protein PilN [Formivibrio citricus]
MIRINLLPHREHKRQARRRRFLSMLVFGFLGAVGVAMLGFTVLTTRIDTQKQRNQFLANENKKLDLEIAEINKLKAEKQALLDRKKVVERLQSNRTESVRILDQLVRQTPEGVYLKEFKQTGDKMVLTGYAQSNARVSAYMRNLNDSPVFEQPLLNETKAATVGNLRLSEFSVQSQTERPAEKASAPAAVAGKASAVAASTAAGKK